MAEKRAGGKACVKAAFSAPRSGRRALTRAASRPSCPLWGTDIFTVPAVLLEEDLTSAPMADEASPVSNPMSEERFVHRSNLPPWGLVERHYKQRSLDASYAALQTNFGHLSCDSRSVLRIYARSQC
jgi:hypothetical protein